jgi:hypothetical protein
MRAGKRAWKKLLIGALVVVGLGVAGAYGYYRAMVGGLIRYNEYDIRTEGQLQVGDLAPDLSLARVRTKGEESAGPSHRMLSELYRDKPVVLAFGSYT